MLFFNCPRQFYYKKVLKLPDDGDKKYGQAGSVVHDMLDEYYRSKFHSIKLNNIFDNKWYKKYSLPEVIDKKRNINTYKSMFLKALKLKLRITMTELVIDFNDFKYIIDGVTLSPISHNDTGDNINPNVSKNIISRNNKFITIIDWKTSWEKSSFNVNDYTMQLRCYAWGYYRKYGIIVDKCIVYYLNTGETIKIKPNIDTITKTEKFFNSVINRINNANGLGIKHYPCKKCDDFCPYVKRCMEDNNIICQMPT